MKRLFLKLVVLVIAVSGSSLILSNYLLPEFWARTEPKVKLAYWKKHGSEYNTVFIGSSRIFHQVNPRLFDSLANANNISVNSFNLGVPSFPFPQSYRMIEAALAEYSDVTTVYYEITPVYLEPAEALKNTPENYYWYDLDHTVLLCDQIQHSAAFDKQTKWTLCGGHAGAWMQKNLFLGGAQALYTTATDVDNGWISSRCAATDGYVSLDVEMSIGPKVEGATSRRKQFLADTSILIERKAIAAAYNSEVKDFRSTPYSLFLGKLFNQLTARGIKVYFVIPPRLTDYDALYDVLSEIPREHVLNLSSPALYPEFYLSRYAFDKGHLNASGAAVFTRELFNLSLNKR